MEIKLFSSTFVCCTPSLKDFPCHKMGCGTNNPDVPWIRITLETVQELRHSTQMYWRSEIQLCDAVKTTQVGRDLWMWSKPLLKTGLVGSGYYLISCSVKIWLSTRMESTSSLGNLFQYLIAVIVKYLDILLLVLYFTNAEFIGKITFPDLLASLLLRKPSTWLALLAARTRCWFGCSLLSTWIPKTFSAELLPKQPVLTPYCCMGLLHPRYTPLCLSWTLWGPYQPFLQACQDVSE